MITVLHILNELRPSGAEVMLKLAAPYWQEQGIVLHVLSTGKVTGIFADELAQAGFTVHHIPFSDMFSFYSRLIQLMRAYRFDVVHIHTEHATLTYAFLGRLAGIPTIVRTIHSNFLFRNTTRITRMVRRFLQRKLGVVQVSICHAVQKNEAGRFKNPTLRIDNWYDDSHFVPPSITQKKATRHALGLDSAGKYLITIGNCSPIKNHAALLQALWLLRQKGIGIAYLHVGEEDREKTERALAAQLGIGEQVYFLGYQKDVRPYLWAADIFVMPSCYEGLSIALLEAMACGLSIILANSPGLREWADFSPEIIITNPDPENLAKAITQALEVPAARDKDLPRKVREAFSVQRGARAYAELYRNFLRNRELMSL